MELTDLFMRLNCVANSVHIHWNLFSMVAMGVTTGLAVKEQKLARVTGVLLVVILLVFMSYNFFRIKQTNHELQIIDYEIKSQIASVQQSPRFKEFYMHEYSSVNDYWSIFYTAIGSILVFVIVLRTNWRKKLNPEESQ